MNATTIGEFRAALMDYQPTLELSGVVFEAQGMASPVMQAVTIFDGLRGVELDEEGSALLMGAAFLIASGSWHGRGGEAAMYLAAAPALEVAAPPAQIQPPMTPPE